MKIDLGEDFVFDLNKDEKNISLAERLLQAAFSDLAMQVESLNRKNQELTVTALVKENVTDYLATRQ